MVANRCFLPYRNLVVYTQYETGSTRVCDQGQIALGEIVELEDGAIFGLFETINEALVYLNDLAREVMEDSDD
ncbi:MAG: hypothetical protein ABH846_04215 [Patescibacteria group bacterium]